MGIVCSCCMLTLVTVHVIGPFMLMLYVHVILFMLSCSLLYISFTVVSAYCDIFVAHVICSLLRLRFAHGCRTAGQAFPAAAAA